MEEDVSRNVVGGAGRWIHRDGDTSFEVFGGLVGGDACGEMCTRGREGSISGFYLF